MKRKEIVAALFFAAAAMAVSPGLTWSQSVGGTQSKRSGESDTPVGEGRFGDPSNPGKGAGSASQAPTGTGQTGKDTSVGGTQSKRSGESDTPVGEGRFGDSSKTEKGSGKTSQAPSGTRQNKDTSIGGSQSKRSGESDTPVGEGRFGDSSKSDRGSRSVSQASGTGGHQDIRQAQEALKNQGHDPGPIDGVMGPQTRQALRAFQSSNGLKQSGMLDAETKQKLNVEDSSSRGSMPMGQGESFTGQRESSPMSR